MAGGERRARRGRGGRWRGSRRAAFAGSAPLCVELAPRLFGSRACRGRADSSAGRGGRHRAMPVPGREQAGRQGAAGTSVRTRRKGLWRCKPKNLQSVVAGEREISTSSNFSLFLSLSFSLLSPSLSLRLPFAHLQVPPLFNIFLSISSKRKVGPGGGFRGAVHKKIPRTEKKNEKPKKASTIVSLFFLSLSSLFLPFTPFSTDSPSNGVFFLSLFSLSLSLFIFSQRRRKNKEEEFEFLGVES